MDISQFLVYIFNPDNFTSHGTHFEAVPALFWTFVIANLITFIAYTGIPILLIYFVRKRKDLVFNWAFVFFAAFIVLCGLHHLLHTITFFYPIYGIEAINDVLMAIVSIGTFFSLLPILPQAIKLTSPKQLVEANELLSKEIQRRQAVESVLLENTATLNKQTQDLKDSQEGLIKKNEELKKMNDFMVDRETKMAQLKKENEELKAKLNS